MSIICKELLQLSEAVVVGLFDEQADEVLFPRNGVDVLLEHCIMG